MILCIFNPEHDLSLANGGLNFMAPRSALQFAEHSSQLMQVLYPNDAICTDVANAGRIYAEHSDITNVVAWGWNCALKNQLIKQGISNTLLPSDEDIETIRHLSHRTTAMPLANALNMGYEVRAATSLDEIKLLLERDAEIVLKAPWSGSGRGLRWISNRMTMQDENWTKKIIREQGCVMVEHRHRVVQNFGLEYWIGDGVSFVGYSLFEALNGVYRGNRLWNDERIEDYLSQYITAEELQMVNKKLQDELYHLTLGRYCGPLGIDMMIAQGGGGYYLVSVVEINFRHTMGHVAHALSNIEGADRDNLWSPML